MVTTLAMTDALTKLLIEKGIITDAEFKQKLLEDVRYTACRVPPDSEHWISESGNGHR
jgi:hypothetical protein